MSSEVLSTGEGRYEAPRSRPRRDAGLGPRRGPVGRRRLGGRELSAAGDARHAIASVRSGRNATDTTGETASPATAGDRRADSDSLRPVGLHAAVRLGLDALRRRLLVRAAGGGGPAVRVRLLSVLRLDLGRRALGLGVRSVAVLRRVRAGALRLVRPRLVAVTLALALQAVPLPWRLCLPRFQAGPLPWRLCLPRVQARAVPEWIRHARGARRPRLRWSQRRGRSLWRGRSRRGWWSSAWWTSLTSTTIQTRRCSGRHAIRIRHPDAACLRVRRGGATTSAAAESPVAI